MVTVRPLRDDEVAWAAEHYAASWGAPVVVRRGEQVDLRALPALVGEVGGQPGGLATYAIHEDGLELASLVSMIRASGVGTALIAALREEAARAGCGRLWVVTTNDNTPALRFYQRAGFDLAVLRRGAVDTARAGVKPEIPPTGRDGIPIRHELELELVL